MCTTWNFREPPPPNSTVICGCSWLKCCCRSRGSNLVFEPWFHTKWKGRWQRQEWKRITCQGIISSPPATNVWKIFWVHITVLAPFFGLGSTYLLLVIPGNEYWARWTFVLTWYTTSYMVVGSRLSFKSYKYSHVKQCPPIPWQRWTLLFTIFQVWKYFNGEK